MTVIPVTSTPIQAEQNGKKAIPAHVADAAPRPTVFRITTRIFLSHVADSVQRDRHARPPATPHFTGVARWSSLHGRGQEPSPDQWRAAATPNEPNSLVTPRSRLQRAHDAPCAIDRNDTGSRAPPRGSSPQCSRRQIETPGHNPGRAPRRQQGAEGTALTACAGPRKAEWYAGRRPELRSATTVVRGRCSRCGPCRGRCRPVAGSPVP